MKSHQIRNRTFVYTNQSGAALAVVLVLLLVMTLLGTAVLRNTLLDERMSGNLYDRNLAFQAAESGLREAEQRIQDIQIATNDVAKQFPSTGCSEGLCARPTGLTTDRWIDPAFDGWRDATVVLQKMDASPEYFIESMGEAPAWPLCDREIPQHPQCMKQRFRITASNQSAGRARVMLQTNYSVK